MTAPADTQHAMWRLLTAFRVSRSIGVVVELGIPDLLAGGPRTIAEIAVESGAHEDSLLRLLRLLLAVDILTRDRAGRYGLTRLGEELRSDRMGPVALLLDGHVDWAAWGHLDHSIEHGERGFDRAHGVGPWDYYEANPGHAAVFDAAMRALTGPVAEAVAAGYDFSHAGTVADIGGGDGTLLIAVLKSHPHLRGLLFDRPDVVGRARPGLEAAAMSDRVNLVGGSFFEELPSGADVYLLKSILHDWDDDDCVAILRRCRAAADAKGAHLLVVERGLSDEIGPDDLDSALSDLHMLVKLGGRERTTTEYSRLLGRAGFCLERTVPAGGLNLLEAVPARP